MVFADVDNGTLDAGEALLDSRGAAADSISIVPRAADTIKPRVQRRYKIPALAQDGSRPI